MVNALLKSLIVDDLDAVAQAKFNETKTKTHDKQSNTTTRHSKPESPEHNTNNKTVADNTEHTDDPERYYATNKPEYYLTIALSYNPDATDGTPRETLTITRYSNAERTLHKQTLFDCYIDTDGKGLIPVRKWDKRGFKSIPAQHITITGNAGPMFSVWAKAIRDANIDNRGMLMNSLISLICELHAHPHGDTAWTIKHMPRTYQQIVVQSNSIVSMQNTIKRCGRAARTFNNGIATMFGRSYIHDDIDDGVDPLLDDITAITCNYATGYYNAETDFPYMMFIIYVLKTSSIVDDTRMHELLEQMSSASTISTPENVDSFVALANIIHLTNTFAPTKLDVNELASMMTRWQMHGVDDPSVGMRMWLEYVVQCFALASLAALEHIKTDDLGITITNLNDPWYDAKPTDAYIGYIKRVYRESSFNWYPTHLADTLLMMEHDAHGDAVYTKLFDRTLDANTHDIIDNRVIITPTHPTITRRFIQIRINLTRNIRYGAYTDNSLMRRIWTWQIANKNDRVVLPCRGIEISLDDLTQAACAADTDSTDSTV